MKGVNVNGENFNLIAAKYYDDLGATDLDFQEDLRRFLLIKRLFNQYRKSKVDGKIEIKERLILNHIIIINNVFREVAVDLLFYSLKDYLPELSVFLIFLNKLPKKVGDIVTTTIPMDQYVIQCLRSI